MNAAAKLFRERGYDATSMQEIADQMGILKGSVYHYVKTKEDLLWMVVEPPFSQLVEGAEQILSDSELTHVERLRRAMVAHAESYEAHYPHMFVMTRESGETLSKKRRTDLINLKREYVMLWRGAVVDGQEAGEIRGDISPTIAVHAMIGMLNWMSRWYRRDGGFTAREIAEQFANVALEGLGVGDHVEAAAR